LARRALVSALLVACLAAGFVESPAAGAEPVAHRSIIGGSPADPAQFGFAVALLYRGRFICSGSVIAPTKILTAGHCGAGFSPSDLTVVAGRPNLSDAASGQAIAVTAISVHPDYGFGLHDVSVLTLSQPAGVPPVPLATGAVDSASTFPGATLSVAGYGDRNPFIFGREKVGSLHTTTETVRTNCVRFDRAAFVPEGMICALGQRFRGTPLHRSTCFGDSGGPLVTLTPSGAQLVGVNSIVQSIGFAGLIAPCGGGKGGNEFTRVSAELPFIAEAVGTGPPIPRTASYAGPASLRVRRRIEFPVTCSVTCHLNVALTFAVAGRNIGPVPVRGDIPAGQTSFVSLVLPRRAVTVLRRIGGALVSRMDATFASGAPAETHTRIFGFKTQHLNARRAGRGRDTRFPAVKVELRGSG